jgi:glycosyltransferase involved in cell wall biosynthesis
MRIGLVVTGGVDRSGRTRVIPALLWLIERLARRHDVHVFALHYEATPCTYPLLGATVHDLGTRHVANGWRRIVQARRLRAALRQLPPFDVLHAYWGIPAGWVATSAGRNLGVPVVVTADSGEFVGNRALNYGFQRRWVDRRLMAQTMERARAVTVCTAHMASLAEGLGIHADVIPIGVPRELFGDAARMDGPPWRLVHVGHLNRVKDQATLLRAFASLRMRQWGNEARHPDTHLDVVGEDTLGGQVQQLAHDLGLGASVTFHGALTHDAVCALYARAHVHVMSSRHEAAGVSVLEAAAAGVPTVGTHVGYIADWSPGAAVSVAPGDSQALADALAGVLSDRESRLVLGRRAQIQSAAMTADDTAAAFEALYRSLH